MHLWEHQISFKERTKYNATKIINVLTLDDIGILLRVRHQKEFLFCLYSVCFLVSTIFLLFIFLAYTNPIFYDTLKQYFIFNTSNLNTNVFLSSYTHSTQNHLRGNILSYSIVLWLIFSLVDNKNKLKLLMLMSLIVFPFLNSILLTLFFDISAGGGLSGIVACLYGYLFFAGYYNLNNNLQLSVKISSVFMLIFFNLFVAQYIILKNYYVLLFAIVIFILLIYQNGKNIRFMWEHVKNVEVKYIEQLRFITIWVSALVFSLTVFRILSPASPTNLEIDYEVHYIGWFYGLIVSWVIMHDR